MMPDSECETIDSAMAALKKRFKPADIEELRGFEFHYRAQGGDESIEQLGLSIQQLGRKAFPTIVGKDFDRLIKGRFYQALLIKWQRKLGCPKPDEGFHDLLAHVRMFEEHEEQFAASAQTQNEVKKGSGVGSQKVPQYKPPHKQDPEKLPGRAVNRGTVSFRERRCHKCKQIGHIRKDCLVKTEIPGCTPQVTNTSAVGATEFLFELRI